MQWPMKSQVRFPSSRMLFILNTHQVIYETSFWFDWQVQYIDVNGSLYIQKRFVLVAYRIVNQFPLLWLVRIGCHYFFFIISGYIFFPIPSYV